MKNHTMKILTLSVDLMQKKYIQNYSHLEYNLTIEFDRISMSEVTEFMIEYLVTFTNVILINLFSVIKKKILRSIR